MPSLGIQIMTAAATSVTFRCSAQEAERARRRAAREGVTLSVALRGLLADYAAGRMPTVLMARESEAIRKELRAIGINLNQSARSLNMGHHAPELGGQLRELVAVVRRMYGQLEAQGLVRRPRQ